MCPLFPQPPPPPWFGTQPVSERALYEEAAHITKRIRVLHPKTSPAGYCAPLGGPIRFVSDFSSEGTKEQRVVGYARKRVLV
jgi:hypothetical protein